MVAGNITNLLESILLSGREAIFEKVDVVGHA
jgi:hypothetical protein